MKQDTASFILVGIQPLIQPYQSSSTSTDILVGKKMLKRSFVFLFAAVSFCHSDNRYCQCSLPFVDADPLGILLQPLFVDYSCFG